jgi:DNA-binding NtrC family response regulator
MTDTAILCVDDEVMILKSLEIELQAAFGSKYLYELAESAEEALEIMEELDEEGLQLIIIISDWLMPGMKGDEFLINVHQKYPHIIKIMLTGQATEEAIERARKYANLYYCFAKPWKSRELVNTIQSALAQL